MQDIARPHTAYLVDNFLEAETEHHIQSPELSFDLMSMFGTRPDDELLHDQGLLLLSKTWRSHFIKSGVVFPGVSL